MAFRRAQKKGPLNPLRISPRFLVRGLAGCRQRGIPAALFCGRFSCRAWVYGVQRLRGFLLFVLVTLSSSKVGTVGDHGPRSPLWNLYAHSRYNM